MSPEDRRDLLADALSARRREELRRLRAHPREGFVEYLRRCDSLARVFAPRRPHREAAGRPLERPPCPAPNPLAMDATVRSRWSLREPDPELAARYRAAGHWTDETLASFLERRIAAAGRLGLRIWSGTRPYRGTVDRVWELARRLAGGLRRLGVQPGDVVAVQLPNWVEAAAAFWAVPRLGAVLVPIVPYYGTREVSFILRQSGARALLLPDRFRSVDYLAQLERIRSDAPELELVAVVGERTAPGTVPFSRLLEAPPLAESVPAAPGEPAIVAYTSGTTSDPKGVVHTHRSFLAEVRQLASIQASGERPSLTGAPTGHFIGMLAGLFLPLERGQPIHLTDAWDPAAVLRAIEEADLGAGSGSTFFLTSLLDHPGLRPEHLERMRHVGLGGAPVPAAVAERAASLGISIIRSYGCSEQPSITGSRHDDPPAKRMHTDGAPLAGVEIRLVDESGRDVPAGEPGEILSRGPELFAGYTDPELTAASFDAEGWYATGDIGVLDGNGWLTITDRKKDIIIRGGENVSAGEVEELIAEMPGVAEVAVVAAPDPRLGEHGCAFIRPAPGREPPDLDAVRRHLEAAGLAKQKWPEEVRTSDELPRTPSGKVKKYALREMLRRERPAGA